MKFLRVGLALSAALLWTTLAFGQANLDDVDFARIQVDELSDSQIRLFLDRAEANNVSLAELEKLALARGMRPSEVVKLRARIRALSAQRRSARNEPEAPRQEQGAGEDPFSLLTRARNAYREADEQDDSLGFRTEPDSLRKRIFGEELFNTEELTFEPSLNIPPPENYRLAPGDELVVNIWGAAENSYQLPVERDGTVRVDRVGPIYVNGLTVEEAQQRVLAKLRQVYSGLGEVGSTSADLTLTRLRSIKVNILGEVERPGSYTLPALSTVFTALYACGGPSEDGTYRAVQVIRGNRLLTELDVYAFLVGGDLTNNVRLQDQDIIKVDPYRMRVEMSGEVKRPLLFEVRPDETLGDLIRFAGDFKEGAYRRRLKIHRNTATERRILDVTSEEFDGFALQNGDRAFVGRVLDRFENRVEVRGAVYRQGEYELGDAQTVHGLIHRAEGLRGDAFLTRANIYRTRDDLTVEMISLDLGEIMQDPAAHDVPLRKDDVLVIPSIFDLKEEYTVEIEGAVQNPGEFPYMEEMTLKDLIVMADGLKDEASLLRIEVSRRRTDAATEAGAAKIADIFQFAVDRDLSLETGAEEFELEPFDQVFVRKSPGYIEQRNVRLTGEVQYPGTYTISSKQDRISDLIRRAGGLTGEAYPRGALLTRTNNQVGPVGVNLEQILNNPNSLSNLLVEDGDEIHIPQRLQTVKVSGAVFYPVSVGFDARLDLKDYLDRAGGTTDQADEGKIYVVYANGNVDRIRRRLFVRHYPRLEPGAQIVVPVEPEPQKMSPQERTLILSSIVSVAAIVATTLAQLLPR